MMRTNSVLAAVLAAAWIGAGRSDAATVTASLDVYYGDSNGDNIPDTAAAGSWQLVARSSVGDNRGIAGFDAALTGVVNALGGTGATFRAPNGTLTGSGDEVGFPMIFGSKPWTQDQDGSAATLDMLFGQIISSAPGPQVLFYDVGQTSSPSIKASNDQANGQPVVPGLSSVVTWNFDDPLGDYLADSNQADNDGAFQRGVILAQGRFNAGATPAFVSGGASANVFTALGSQSSPPPAGSIQGATMATETRNNLFTFAGDVNLDHAVTGFGPNGDGAIIAINEGRSGDVLWQQGDLNGDKDCDLFQIDFKGDAQILTSSLGLGGEPPPPAQALVAAGIVAAFYNAVTGELSVDVGAGVGVFGFTTAGLFNTGVNPNENLGALSLQFDASTLGFFNGGNPLPTGLFSLGNVLPAGLSQGQIQFGFTANGMAGVQGQLAIVPEGTTAGLTLGAAIAGALWRRRSSGGATGR